MHAITMPKLSDSMEVGKIVHWKVRPGDEVRAGDVIAEIESDKATMELECFADGRLAAIKHGEGDEVAVGEVIALIAEEGEEAEAPAEAKKPPAAPKKAAAVETKPKPSPRAQAAKAPAPPQPVRKEPAPLPPAARAGERVAISPYARKLAREKGVDYSGIKGAGPGGRIVARDIEAAAGAPAGSEKHVLSPAPTSEPDPLARQLLDRYGYDLGQVAGTGPGGQVTVDDAIRALTGKSPARVKPSPDEELPALDIRPDEAEIEDAPFRMKTLARIVTASKHVIPHFYVTRGVDVTELLKRKEEAKEKYGATVTHLIALACLRALKEHPEINRSYERGRIIRWRGVNLGLAVDAPDGLTVAVLRNAQELGLKDLAERLNGLVERARSGRLLAEDRRHPTFTITNLGMFDVEHFQPIINPPSAVTLAVASALPAPVIRGESIAIARVLRLTASCDHRIINGVDAAKFLSDVKARIESPGELLA